MAVVFFSYSHADEALRDRQEKSLVMLERQGLIESFHDRRIPPGDLVDEAISEQLERADIILLLVSPDFLVSRYCYGIEMGRALERAAAKEARVIPVILRPCEWKHSPLKDFMALPTDGKPITKFADLDDAFLDVSEGIRKALQAMGTPKPSTRPGAAPKSAPAAAPGPRSSNLQLKRLFSDIDKDRFRDDAFDYIARFFENSMAELQERNRGVEGIFKRIDAHQFTAQLYRDGEKKASCRIFIETGYGGRGIAISLGDHHSSGGCNESLRVEAEDSGLFLRTMGMASYSGEKRHLTFEGGAELYWGMLMEGLRR